MSHMFETSLTGTEITDRLSFLMNYEISIYKTGLFSKFTQWNNIFNSPFCIQTVVEPMLYCSCHSQYLFLFQPYTFDTTTL